MDYKSDVLHLSPESNIYYCKGAVWLDEIVLSPGFLHPNFELNLPLKEVSGQNVADVVTFDRLSFDESLSERWYMA